MRVKQAPLLGSATVYHFLTLSVTVIHLFELLDGLKSSPKSSCLSKLGLSALLSEWEEVSFDLRDGVDAYEVLLAHQFLKD